MALATGDYGSRGLGHSMIWLWVLVFLGVGALALLAYWQLIIAEGAYLGPWVVTKTYDWFAHRYDGVKRFNPEYERWFIAGPLMQALWRVKRPLLLDVATGTGRLPMALLQEGFVGQIIGLDLSRGMLRQTRTKLEPYQEQVDLIWQDASMLPFHDGVFDAVTCLESLEFLPQPLEALAEMVRVLAPGGTLLLTNRVGRESRLLPGRALPRPLFKQVLTTYPLRDVQIRPWQADYDLAMARKKGHLDSTGQGGVELASLLRCPSCGGLLRCDTGRLACPACGRFYPIREGIVWLARSESKKGRPGFRKALDV
jgi:ubiquinone/menaquinone biosynthesis C-methylase UbiE/uncharacterized protein YbaR (Trm112 family)